MRPCISKSASCPACRPALGVFVAVDHHELIAMIAPRAVIALGNPECDWLGDESGYKAVVAAKEAFKALGVEANLGFDFTGNHGHCQAPSVNRRASPHS